MKKSRFRPIIFSVIFVASMFSYIFMHCCATTNLPEKTVSTQIEEQEQIEEESVSLPDLEMVQKSLNALRKILPSS